MDNEYILPNQVKVQGEEEITVNALSEEDGNYNRNWSVSYHLR